MSQQSTNVVVLSGNLVRDPELRALPGDSGSVCDLRIAVNGRRKTAEGWVDDPSFFGVSVYGAQGEACAKFLKVGRPVNVVGRLDHQEWRGPDGELRSKVIVVADSVQFLNARTPAEAEAVPA